MKAKYTVDQIKNGTYEFRAIFGYVVDNPLPFRMVGFEETDVDGIYESIVHCGETLQDVIRARYRVDLVMGIYQLSADGMSWHLIPKSWEKSFAAAIAA